MKSIKNYYSPHAGQRNDFMTYEELQIQHSNLNIMEMDLSDVKNLKGLYFNENIAIEKSLTQKEKACVLAEELGHHYTSAGNILDLEKSENIKQERRARMWAYNKQIGLVGIINAYKRGCRNLHEMAEYLDITEEFLRDALEAYRSKYGHCVIVDNYIIYFEPYLTVADFNYHDTDE